MEHIKGASFGKALELLANIRPDWKALQREGSLQMFVSTDIKSFITFPPGACIIKLIVANAKFSSLKLLIYELIYLP